VQQETSDVLYVHKDTLLDSIAHLISSATYDHVAFEHAEMVAAVRHAQTAEQLQQGSHVAGAKQSWSPVHKTANLHHTQHFWRAC